MDTQLPVLFEDNHVIAVFKAPGLLTQGDYSKTPSLLDVTKYYLKQKHGKPGNVFLGLLHRLDRPCAGVVLFAKTSKAASRVSSQIRNRSVEKTYRIVVEGALTQREGEFTDSLLAKRADCVSVVDLRTPHAKLAQLRYRILRSSQNTHWVEVDLVTGRKHQIRAQFGARNLPVLGDTKYGSRHPYDAGIALLSYKISFDHPISASRITVVVPEALSPLAKDYE